MKLNYKAVTEDGKIVRGVIEAKDVAGAAIYLRNRGFLPIKISKRDEKGVLKYIPFLNRTKSSDVVFFTRQLSSMLSSGLTIMQALNILKEQIQSPVMAEIVRGIILEIEEGKSFSEAISKYPNVFSPIYISLIKASETSGLLDKIMLRLSENLEKNEKLKSTVKSALMYPVIVLIAMTAVMIIMMFFVMPQLLSLYESLNIELPITTKIVMGISNFIMTFWPFVIGGVVLLGFLFKRWHKTETGQLLVDSIILRLPVFGKLIKQTVLTEFTRTFGLLVGAGTLVVEALRQSSNVAGNIHYKNAIIGVSKRVERGITIGDALSAYPLFPPMVVEMVKIGEQTGKLDESLSRVSEYYEREVDQTVKTLTTAMEPIMMVVLGIGVAFLIISVITPIYKLTSAF